MARVASAGGANCEYSVSTSAGSRVKRSLATSMASCTAPTRATGSAWSVGMGAKMADTRFVQRSSSSPVRIDTGIMATSGLVGSASWSSR